MALTARTTEALASASRAFAWLKEKLAPYDNRFQSKPARAGKAPQQPNTDQDVAPSKTTGESEAKVVKTERFELSAI